MLQFKMHIVYATLNAKCYIAFFIKIFPSFLLSEFFLPFPLPLKIIVIYVHCENLQGDFGPIALNSTYIKVVGEKAEHKPNLPYKYYSFDVILYTLAVLLICNLSAQNLNSSMAAEVQINVALSCVTSIHFLKARFANLGNRSVGNTNAKLMTRQRKRHELLVKKCSQSTIGCKCKTAGIPGKTELYLVLKVTLVKASLDFLLSNKVLETCFQMTWPIYF